MFVKKNTQEDFFPLHKVNMGWQHENASIVRDYTLTDWNRCYAECAKDKQCLGITARPDGTCVKGDRAFTLVAEPGSTSFLKSTAVGDPDHGAFDGDAVGETAGAAPAEPAAAPIGKDWFKKTGDATKRVYVPTSEPMPTMYQFPYTDFITYASTNPKVLQLPKEMIKNPVEQICSNIDDCAGYRVSAPGKHHFVWKRRRYDLFWDETKERLRKLGRDRLEQQYTAEQIEAIYRM